MGKVASNTSVYVFIDASNLWEAQKTRGKFFDLAKLQKYLQELYRAHEIKIYYYTAYPAEGTRTYSTAPKHQFYTYLKKALGFVVRKKPLKRLKSITEEGEVIEEKGNMDVEMTIDAVNLVKKYDTAVLFTGDSDFLGLVNYIKNRGKKVYIYSSRNNVSTEMRTGGHGYSDVLNIKADIWGRELHFRGQKNKNAPLLGGAPLDVIPRRSKKPLDNRSIAKQGEKVNPSRARKQRKKQ